MLYQLENRHHSINKSTHCIDNSSCITIHPGSQVMTIHHPQDSDKSATIILSPQAQGTELRDIIQWQTLMTGNVIEVEKH